MPSSLAAERSTVLKNAHAIVDAAKAAGRELSAAEQVEVEAAIAKIGALDRQAKSAPPQTKTRPLFSRYPTASAGPVGVEFDPDTASGGVFTPEAKAGIVHAVKTRTAYRTEVDAKALLTTDTLLPTSGNGVAQGLHPSAYPLSALFGQEQAPGPVIRYYRMTSGTAAVVAEGALKPDAGVQIDPVDLALEKIAGTAQFSDEMGMDAPYLVSAVELELRAAVAQAENARIVNTFATTSGIQTGAGTAATVVDAVADAIGGQESLSGLTPSAVIANPTVVAAIRKTKASTAGVYVLDPTQAGPTTIFGVPVISTAATDAATVWVVESSGVTIFRRGGLTVEVGTNADDFTHNIRTMIAEERMGTAVTRPSSLTKIILS